MNKTKQGILLWLILNMGARILVAQPVNKARSDSLVIRKAVLPDTGYYTDSRGKATYRVEKIAGFKVLINTIALKHSETNEAIMILKDKLSAFQELMDKKHLNVLKDIPVWIDWDFPEQQTAMCFHPSKQWLEEHEMPSEKPPGIQIYNVKKFI